ALGIHPRELLDPADPPLSVAPHDRRVFRAHGLTRLFPSIHLKHLFSAVRRVANETLVSRIDDEIEQFQRNLTNEYGRVFREFNDIHLAFSSLDGQAHTPINMERRKTGAGPSNPGSEGDQGELIDEGLRHRKSRRARINQGIAQLDPMNLLVREKPFLDHVEIANILDPRRNRHPAHCIGSHGSLALEWWLGPLKPHPWPRRRPCGPRR